jgi:hypothetical protein
MLKRRSQFERRFADSCFFKTLALILTDDNRDALSQLVKIDHEQNEMADPWET